MHREKQFHVASIENCSYLAKDPSNLVHKPGEAKWLQIAALQNARHNLNIPKMQLPILMRWILPEK
jgi:hypothetical protein